MNKNEERKWAAMIAALGACRGLLYAVQAGDYSQAEVEAILNATSLSNLASVLGLSDADLAVDTSRYLTQNELDRIRPVSIR